MAFKLMTLRRDDTCAACCGAAPASTQAWWDTSRKQVTCTRCRPVDFAPAGTSRRQGAHELAPPQPIAVGVAGHSADQAHQRRLEWYAASDEFDPLASVPQHISAWEKGAMGERELGDFLDGIADGRAVVLHDRKVPGTRGNIDHIMIASSGVWVIDAKNYDGHIGFRTTGLFRSTVTELYIGPRRQTKLVEAMQWQCDAVRALTEPMGMGGVPIRPALCFLQSEWKHPRDIETIHEVIIAPPLALGAVIMRDGWVMPDAINAIATQLSSGLPATARI